MVNIAPPVYKTLMAWKWNTARDSPGKTSSLQSQFDFLEAEEAAPLSRTRNDPHVWPPSQSQTLPTSTEPLLLKSSKGNTKLCWLSQRVDLMTWLVCYLASIVDSNHWWGVHVSDRNPDWVADLPRELPRDLPRDLPLDLRGGPGLRIREQARPRHSAGARHC